MMGGMRTRLRSDVDSAVASANAPITVASALLNLATGAKVRFDKHHTVVCEGGWLSNRGLSNVFTTGNTFNVKSGYEDKFRGNDALLEHEWRHSVQWALLGPVRFLPLYAISYFGSQRVNGTQCWNVFEWTAGFEDGGYLDCAGFGDVPDSVSGHAGRRRLHQGRDRCTALCKRIAGTPLGDHRARAGSVVARARAALCDGVVACDRIAISDVWIRESVRRGRLAVSLCRGGEVASGATALGVAVW